MAVYDFGLSSAEFGRMTPGMFAALAERRAFRFRRDSYLAGLVASTIWNSVPRGKDAQPVSPFDFVPQPEADAAEIERQEVKQNILAFFSVVEIRTPEHAQQLRERVLKGLKAEGYADAEEIFDEVFAAWAVKRAEQQGGSQAMN